jgi:hypothetical protein
MENLKAPHRIGAIFYVLWGLLHVVVGAIPVVNFLSGGPREMLLAIVGMQNVPSTVQEPLRQASYFIAQHYFNLIAVGILAIIVAVTLNWRNRPLGFWTNFIVLGLVDVAFVMGEMVPGYMPLEMGIMGPVLFVLGALFTAVSLVGMPEREVESQLAEAT